MFNIIHINDILGRYHDKSIAHNLYIMAVYKESILTRAAVVSLVVYNSRGERPRWPGLAIAASHTRSEAPALLRSWAPRRGALTGLSASQSPTIA